MRFKFKRSTSIAERLDFYSMPVTECGCWIWMGRVNQDGYGMLDVGNATVGAHRLSFTVHNGVQIPKGMSVLHHCDVPACINPNHLYLGTQADNVRDRTNRRRGKNPRYTGSAHPMAKLTEADVAAIRASTEKQQTLAARYGIAQSAVSNIKCGRRWGQK